MKNAADTVDLSYLGVCGLWGMVQIEMFLSLTEQTCFFFLPFLCVSASQINVTLHYNRSCRDYFSADRKPVRKRACRWQAFAFLCLLSSVKREALRLFWNATKCLWCKHKGKDSRLLSRQRRLRSVYQPGFSSRSSSAAGRRTPNTPAAALGAFSINISYSRFTGFCFSVKSPVQPVRGRKESKHHVFHLTQANFFKWKCVVT